MIIKCLVMDEQPDSYKPEGKPSTHQWVYLLQDMGEHRTKTQFRLSVPRQEQDTEKPGLRDTFVALQIESFIAMFGGAVMIRGKITPWVEPETGEYAV